MSWLAGFHRPGLFRTVIAPVALLTIVAVGGLIAGFVVHGSRTLSEQGALHLGCVFAAVTLGAVGAAVVLKSGGFDLSAGPILLLALTIIAWGVREDVAVICVFGDNLPGATEKFQRNQAELAAKKAGAGWKTLEGFYHDVARNSRHLERLQFIRKSGASFSPYSPGLAVLLAVGAALALGALNGAVVRWLPVSSLFATLCTSVVALSWAQYLSNSAVIQPAREQVPAWLGLPQPGHVCAALVGAIVVGLLLRFGCLRSSAPAAIGVSVPQDNATRDGKTMAAYILAGLLAGVAGICLFPRFNAGGAVEGLGWELRILAAAAVGGAMLGRQRGVIWGTVVGAALIALIDFGGQQLGLIGPMRDVLLGALFVALLAIDRPTVAAQVSPAHL